MKDFMTKALAIIVTILAALGAVKVVSILLKKKKEKKHIEMETKEQHDEDDSWLD